MTLVKAKKLKVGSVVCDCRFSHLKVVEIKPHRPAGKRGKIRDFFLKLEDGSNCSALHCCDNPNHRRPHPKEAQSA